MRSGPPKRSAMMRSELAPSAPRTIGPITPRSSLRVRAARPASAASSASVAPGSAWRRSLAPVRFTIQASSTPRRSAIGPLATTRSGTAIPTDAIAAPPETGLARPGRRSSPVASSGTGGLQVGKRQRLDLGKRPPDKTLQHLARPDLDEALGTEIAEGRHRLAPADGANQG